MDIGTDDTSGLPQIIFLAPDTKGDVYPETVVDKEDKDLDAMGRYDDAYFMIFPYTVWIPVSMAVQRRPRADREVCNNTPA